jgi:hypothetical protein
MSPFKKIRTLLPVIPVLMALSVTTQNYTSKNFYKHFTGKLDTTISISMDLFSQNGKISGYYYYYFTDPGNAVRNYYGKTIPLSGSLMGNTVVINEFSKEGSSFKGVFETDNIISGSWQRKPNEKSIPFVLKEDYTKGNTPFTCYSLSDMKYLKSDEKITKNSPKAKISLILLYPDLPSGNAVREMIGDAITRFVDDDSVSFSSPDIMLESIAGEYFNTYFAATDGIESPESRASFQWEKEIDMSICYNENNLISLKIEKTAFTGGSHSITMTQYMVCDLDQRKRLALDDIFTGDYKMELNRILNEKLRALNGIMPVENLSQTGFFEDQIECTENFYVNKDGIAFYYNLYHIARYTAGTTELFIPFSELHGLIKTNGALAWLNNVVTLSDR